MVKPLNVLCQMVEFHRFGGQRALLSPQSQFIRTAGWDGTAVQVAPTLEHDDLLTHLSRLRYDGGVSPEEVELARQALGEASIHFLPPIEPGDGELLQIDLVTNAAELWAFPFEAVFGLAPAWIAGPDRGVVITRRIRNLSSNRFPAWPDVPTMLFAHAPVTKDLEASLVEEHVAALNEALAPWVTRQDAQTSGRLHVREVCSVDDLARARSEVAPTYVHVLAHGARVEQERALTHREEWGLRLGYRGESAASARAVAQALYEPEGSVVAVTVAACDSGNQAGVFASASVIQELHHFGVPVVVGSQLPLTKVGSVALARTFYTRLCRSEDVRHALHAARVELSKRTDAGHDWLSLVGYVRLPPERYADELVSVRLRSELRMLKAAQDRADMLSVSGGSLGEFDEVADRLRGRLASLEGMLPQLTDQHDLDECSGLQASAWKRLAELLTVRARTFADRGDTERSGAGEALEQSRQCYRAAYRANINNHWLGIQQLALDAALSGSLHADEWHTVQRAAELARDAPPIGGRTPDYWSCGTLIEVALLAPLASGETGEDRTAPAAREFVRRVTLRRERGDGASVREAHDAIESTRRQLRRYVAWWTTGNGFFPQRQDLARAASHALALVRETT